MTKSRDNRDDHDPGRRKFLKGVGIVGAGAAIADHLWVEAEAAETTATPESLSGTVKVVLDVNGQKREAQVEPRTTLLNTLRNHLDPAVTGPKLVCDAGTCGACTVLLDGEAVKSCTMFAVQADGASITTVEGLATNGELHPVQEGFWERHGLQCGYCTPGMIMTATQLLDRNANPSREEICHGLEGNLCRCTGYQHIIEAVEYAAQKGPQIHTKTTDRS